MIILLLTAIGLFAADDPIAYYSFSGNANDESGNGLNGTVTGAVLVADRFGSANSAYQFDGSNDKIAIAHNSTLNPGKITVAAWMKWSSYGSGTPTLVSKNGDPNVYGWYLALDASSNKLKSFVSTNGSNTHNLTATTVLDLNTWYFTVLTYDGADQKLYLNAELDGTDTSPVGDLYTGNQDSLYIGFGYLLENFNGDLDDVRIYDRALSETEIDSLYHLNGWKALTDHDGNEYNTVTIGDQVWMAENLKVTHYRNGDPISKIMDNSSWENTDEGAYCNFNNNDANADTYGSLYNWHAANDRRELAPEGWRVPTDEDWKDLEIHMGMTQTHADYEGTWRGSDQGGQLKETGLEHWASPNTGASDMWNFTALPTGARLESGSFVSQYTETRYWTNRRSQSAWHRNLSNDEDRIYRGTSDHNNGFSIRLIKNNTPIVHNVKTDGSGDFTSIQAAIDYAEQGDTILIHSGTYNERINFNGKDYILGSLFLTTGDTAYTSQTILDGAASGSVITLENGENWYSRISGLTIRNGYTSSTNTSESGAGLRLVNSSPRLDHLYIISNNCESGGSGIYTQGGSPVIEDCIISGNDGGSSAAYFSGGDGNVPVEINDCLVESNGSNGIRAAFADIEISRSRLTANTASGFSIQDGSGQLENCLVDNNEAYALYVTSGSGKGELSVINSTVVDNNINLGYTQAGINLNSGASATLTNCIFRNPVDAEIYHGGGDACTTSVNYSLIDGGQSGFGYQSTEGVLDWNAGNIDVDPVFIDEANEDYHLGDSSPCIGAGTTTNAPDHDLENNTRPDPGGSDPDMGAFENSRSAPLPPEAPTNLSVQEGNTKLVLNWDPSTTESASAYYIYRSTSSGFTPTQPDDTLATVTDTFLVDTGVINGTTYYYRVSAAVGDIEGDLTTQTSGTPNPLRWTVKTDGSGDHTNIQAAIDDAADGDTVLVHPGTYYENMSFNGKDIIVASRYLTTADTSYLSQTIIDGQSSQSVVVFNSNETSAARLTGFTLRNGWSGSTPDLIGGGVCVRNSSPSLDHLYFLSNDAQDRGAGIGLDESSSIISDCVFSHNFGNSSSAVELTGSNSDVTIEDCIIQENQTNAGGRNIHVHSGTLTLTRCQIVDNEGRGLNMEQGATATVTNCLFANNKQHAFYVGNSTSELTLVNCTVVGHGYEQDVAEAVFVFQNATVSVKNSIFYNDDVSHEFFLDGATTGNTLNIEYTNIHQGQAGIQQNNNILNWNAGNFNADPLFVDMVNDDYSLGDYSPCIGTATATGAPSDDLTGAARPDPGGSTPDLGAYESSRSAPLAPEAPTNLAIHPKNNELILNWEASTSPSVVMYFIYRSTTQGFTPTQPADTLASIDTTEFMDNDVSNGTTYYYRVSAADVLENESTLSAEISGIPSRQNWTVDHDGSEDFTTIQAAVDAADDLDTVLVHPGTYTENVDFSGKDLVLGSLYLVTADTSYQSQTIIDGGGDVGRCVMFENFETSAARLTGFTLKNGWSPFGDIHSSGGGIRIGNSSPRLDHLYLVSNTAQTGGAGINISSGSPSITHCSFSDNEASSQSFTLCISGDDGSPIVIEDCELFSNTTEYAIRVENAEVQIRRTRISDNDNAGIYFGNTTDILLENSLIDNNASVGIRGNGGGTLDMRHVTVVDNNHMNNAPTGGIEQSNNADVTVINCIISNDHGSEIDYGGGFGMETTVSYTCLPGGEGNTQTNNGTLTWGDGNLDVEPLFTDDQNDDYTLSDYSPCIGTGTTTNSPDHDLLGNARPSPGGSNPDMGAYESSRSAPLPPEAPTNLALQVGNGSISANWDRSATPSVMNYYVYRSETQGFSPIQPADTLFSVPDTFFVDEGVGNDTTYYYLISAVDILGQESTFSAEISGTPTPQLWTVKHDGTGDYNQHEIQWAIDDAIVGDTIIIYPGYYNQRFNYNGKDLVIGSLYLTTGDTSYIRTTEIDGTNSGPVVTFENGETAAAELAGLTLYNGSGQGGGGVRCLAPVTLHHLVIESCSADQGGGIYIDGAAAYLHHIIVRDNNTNGANPDGGGIYLNSSAAVLENMLIVNNHANRNGGGVMAMNSTATLSHVTIAENWADQDGDGLRSQGNPAITVQNSIIWDNSDEGDNISTYSSNPTWYYSAVPEDFTGTGVINAPPIFNDAGNGDFTLKEFSPCIGVADTAVTTADDLDGNARPSSGGDFPDMGCYEHERLTRFDLFTEISAGFASVSNSLMAWGDIDNDGDLDVAIAGDTNPTETNIYRNNGDSTFTNINAGIAGMSDGAALEWGDMDGDGDLDLVLVGAPGSYVYFNVDGQIFSEIVQHNVLPDGLTHGDSDLGDFDLDGDLDLLLCGGQTQGDYRLQVYENDGMGNLNYREVGIPNQFGQGSAEWGDFDIDGDLDILATGNDGAGPRSMIYRNENGDWFNTVSAGLPNLQYGRARWGDYDNDGYPDLVVCGDNDVGDPMTEVMRNQGNGNFNYMGSNLPGAGNGARSDVAWGDLDNDGNLDILLIGDGPDGMSVSALHLNNGDNRYTDISAGIVSPYNGDAEWGDVDGDGDLDILVTGGVEAKIYLNNSDSNNAVPDTPEFLNMVLAGNEGSFSWSAAEDDRTPQMGLSYNLYIRNIDSLSYLMPAMADLNTGYRRVVDRGNVEQNLEWTVRNIPDGLYAWSVQAIDHVFAGSPFAPEDTFFVSVPPAMPSNLHAEIGNSSIRLSWQPLPEPDIVRYRIYRDTSSPAETLVDSTVDGFPPDTFFVDTDLANGQIYFYRVTAVDAIGNESEFSSELSAIPNPVMWSVDHMGFGDFLTIQEGINMSLDGDTVLVYPGSYQENIDFLGLDITVASEFFMTDDTSFIHQTIINGGGTGSVVKFVNGETAGARLTGFTIENGSGVSTTDGVGGGITCTGSSPRLDHLRIRQNTSDSWGGGIYLYQSSAEIHNCGLFNNNAATGGYAIRMNNTMGDTVELFDLQVGDNQSNQSEPHGGALSLEDGTYELWNITVGGSNKYGVYLSLADVSMENILVHGNGIQSFNINHSTVDLNHLTCANNGMGITLSDDSHVDIHNSILSNPGGDEIQILTSGDPCSVNIDHSAVDGGDESVIDPDNELTWGAGNYYGNPIFMDQGFGDFMLGEFSPCIGSADPATASDQDLMHEPRPQPVGSTPDMGALEHAQPSQRPWATTPRDGTGDDITWWNQSDRFYANWSPFFDDGQVNYTVALGQQIPDDILGWTPAGTDTTGLFFATMAEADTYRVSLMGTDIHGQVSDTTLSDGFIIDLTMPEISSVLDGNEAEDLDYQVDTEALAAQWIGSDGLSGVEFYELGIGTSHDDPNIHPFEIHDADVSDWTIQGLSLVESTTYFALMRVTDSAGNTNGIFWSDGITIDLSPPVGMAIIDGLTEDVTFTASTTQYSASWDRFTDALSGVVEYQHAVGTSPGATDVLDWTTTGVDTFVTISDMTGITDGQIYYQSVRAIDLVGHVSDVIISDGITFDYTAPVSGTVAEGDTADSDWWHSDTTLSFSWTGFSDVTSGIEYYEYAIGLSVGSNNYVGWTNVGLDTSAIHSGLSMTHGATYYVSVRATDAVGHTSTLGLGDGITIDTFNPTVGNPVDSLGLHDVSYQGQADSLMISWTGSDTREIDYYQVSFGTTAGGTDVVDWINVGSATEHTHQGLSLIHAQIYYANVQAYDLAGNTSSVASSDGVIVDITPPATAIVNDGHSDDLAFTASLDELSANWGDFDDSLSGLWYYEYQIGTQALLGDVVGWTSAGTDNSVTHGALSLEHGGQYFFDLRATDHMGHASLASSSDGIVADHVGPQGTTAIDGLLVDHDFQSALDTVRGSWELFVDGHSGLDHYEWQLWDVTGSEPSIPWTSNATDTSITSFGITLVDSHSYEFQVRALDAVANIGNIVVSDGFLADASAPSAPDELVGWFSQDRIFLEWAAPPEADIEYYSVYAGETSIPEDVILTSNTVESEAFTSGFSNGTRYYLSVTATDSTGNESLQSSEVSGIPQVAVVTAIMPDTSYILYPGTDELRVKFSQPIADMGEIMATSTLIDFEVPLNLVSSISDTSIVISLLDSLPSHDVISVTFAGVLDWNDVVKPEFTLDFNTYTLADYDSNSVIDAADLAVFVAAWSAGTMSRELGPVVGIAPNFIRSSDGIFNLEDIMAFTRMWNWSRTELPVLARPSYAMKGARTEVYQDEHALVFEVSPGTRVLEYELTYSASELELGQLTIENEIAMILRHEVDEGRTLFNIGFLDEHEVTALRISLETEGRDDIPIEYSYRMLDIEGGELGRGFVQSTIVPIPYEYALHHNYPNPFNPQTTIEYDLPEQSPLSLEVYDVRGRLVRTLLDTEQSAGYYEIVWQGRDDAGRQLGSGVYFYRLVTPSYQKSYKLLLLK